MNHFNKKLKSFKDVLSEKMGIGKNIIHNDFSVSFKRSELRELEIDLSTKGRDVSIGDIAPSDDETLEYMGKKVILYMRDQYVPTDFKYKYHISWCERLQEMKDQGRIGRYVVSNRRDGVFSVNELDKDTRRLLNENTDKELEVCVNCLGTLKYKDFRFDPRTYKKHVKNFDIKEFFRIYDSSFGDNSGSLNSSGVTPLNEYGANWRSISKAYRETVGWKCQECGENMVNNKRDLEVHHKDRNKFNVNTKNLIALCHTCHEREHENDY